MEDRVFEGRDLEQALHTAADRLGIPEPDLDYEILQQGRRGLFGLGAKSVRIRVMPPVEAIPPQAPPPAAAEASKGDRPARSAPEGSETKTRSGRRRRSRSGRRRSGRNAPGETSGATPREARRPAPAEPERPLSTEGREIETTVQQMIDLMGLELKARARMAGAGVNLELTGADEKLLKRKDAELRTALAFLLNRMSRRTWPDMGRISIGGNGDRRVRDHDVVELVREVAQQVSTTGETKWLRAMNGYERRLVHITIRKYSDLGSSSEGDGSLKKIKIFKNDK